MKKAYDAVATIGTYKDQQGNDKKRYQTVGTVFEDTKGRLSLKLDSVPVSPEWSGWISFYEPKDAQQPARKPKEPLQQAKRPTTPIPASEEFEQEIPF